MSAPPDFRPFFIQAPGTRLRVARFEGAGRGTVMLLTGQSEFIEKYFEVIAELRARGFAVAAMDWRGQGGSERPCLQDRGKIRVADFSEYDSDIAALLEQVVRPMLRPGEKPIALAHSMGGHILLRTLSRMPGAFAAAAISAPMMAIRLPVPPFALRGLSAAMARFGAQHYAWGQAGRDARNVTFERQIVTSDSVRYARTQAILAAQPDLLVTGPTWGWLAAATRSMASMQARGVAEAITLPVMICDAGDDLVCDSAASAAFAKRLPQGRHITIPGARHEILMERDVLRDQWWRAFDAFLPRA